MLCKGDVDEHTNHSRIASETAQILTDDCGYPAFLYCGQHFLKTGAIKVNTWIAVIDKALGIRVMVLFRVCLEDTSLVNYGIRLPSQSILLRQSAIERCDFVSCPYHCGLLFRDNCQYRIGWLYYSKICLICHAESSISLVNIRFIFPLSSSVPS